MANQQPSPAELAKIVEYEEAGLRQTWARHAVGIIHLSPTSNAAGRDARAACRPRDV